MSESTGRRRQLEGVVVSAKSAKTVVVRVERRTRHPLYQRVVRTSTKYHAHDESNGLTAGQRVRIEESRPLSRLKRWNVVAVLD
ncbi:MAG: 30S ribosomal protein S17 [Armatimonadetes bacterium]|nr:30S ribosomal protein S17 [Armatimonadota bacterium]